MKPGYALFVGAITVCGLFGCAGSFIRSQSPEEVIDEGPKVKIVGDMAVPHGMHPLQVEAIALATGLAGTGSDPEQSPRRAVLLDDMQARGVTYPNQVLASPDTSLVMVRAVLRPGIQKGDRFDIEVKTEPRSATTSLRGGFLMETRLKEMAVLKGSVHEGAPLGLAKGPILIDPSADESGNAVALCRGRVLGGGVALQSRILALVLKPDYRNVSASAEIGTAINRRFHTMDVAQQRGVAKPKDDQHIELLVHPRYKDNIERYMQVVRSIAVRETTQKLQVRLRLLERQLLDPITSASAALKLEAIGREGVPALKKGIVDDDPEVRFYSAEALAYLDQTDAVAPLAEAARNEPAFRAFALAALSAMDDFAAYEALRAMLDLPSAETRYGAFRSLWAMNSRDALVRGEELNGQFSYHLLSTSGQPMVHVTRTYRPEIVIFGHDQRLTTPVVLEAGSRIIINAHSADQVTISRFAPNEPDQKRVVTNKLDDCIRAIVELGGTYPDIVQALQQAKMKHALPGRLAVDAVPAAGRSYQRLFKDEEGVELAAGDEAGAEKSARGKDSDGDAAASDGGVVVATPAPDLFGGRPQSRPSSDEEIPAAGTEGESPSKGEDARTQEGGEAAQKAGLGKRLFGKMQKD